MIKRFLLWLLSWFDDAKTASVEYCPRCNRALTALFRIEGSPLCRRCTTWLTIPRELGIEKDVILGLIAAASATVDTLNRDKATGRVSPEDFETKLLELETVRHRHRATLLNIENRIREAMLVGLEKAVTWRQGSS